MCDVSSLLDDPLREAFRKLELQCTTRVLHKLFEKAFHGALGTKQDAGDLVKLGCRLLLDWNGLLSPPGIVLRL